MITRLLRSAVLAVVGMALVGVPALARHDNDRDGDDDERVFVIRDSRPRSGVVVREVRSPRVIVRDRDDDDWRDRFDNDRGRFDDRPYGWSRGRKVGWGNCDLPPGQAKKYGCRNRSNIILRERPVYRRPLFYFGF